MAELMTGVNLSHILLDVALRNLEELALGFLQQVVHVIALVKGLGLDLRGKAYELAGEIFLRHDAGVKLHVCARCHLGGQFGYAQRASGPFEVVVEAQTLGDGEHVDAFAGRS